MAEEEGKGAPAAHPPGNPNTGAQQAPAPQLEPEKTQQLPNSKTEGVQGSGQAQQSQTEQTTVGGGEGAAGSAGGPPQGQPAQRLPMTFKIKM